MTNREIDNLFSTMADMARAMYIREATDEESSDYDMVESVVSNMDDDEYDSFLEAIHNYAWYISEEFEKVSRKTVYMRAYRQAKKYNLPLKACVNWCFID